MRPEGLSRRRRWLVVVIRCVSLFIAGLDSTIVNVALPSTQRDPLAPVSGLQRTVGTYTLVLASLLIVAGSTADRVGRRRIFQTSPVRFTLGSLLCSPTPALGWLVASRVPQAIAGRCSTRWRCRSSATPFTDPVEPGPRNQDRVGRVLVITALASLTYPIIEGPGPRLGSAKTLGCLSLAATALIALIGSEPRRGERRTPGPSSRGIGRPLPVPW
jgi:MFS family permease